MKTTTRILCCVLGLFFLTAENNFAADSPDESIISRTADGQVILRSRRPSGGVADFLPYVPDELLVRFKNNVAPAAKSALHARHRSIPIKRFRHTRNLELVKLPRGADLHRALKSYRDQQDVLYAEPNYLVEHTSVIISNPGTPPPAVIPNDPSFPSQWNLHNTGQNGGTPGADIKAAEAWSITTGSNDVVVAVIDSGIDYTHQDLAANMWRNEADCNNNGIDDDGDGYVDDCYGIDTFNDDSDPMDDYNHGTHVAGIIGAVGNNNLGVVGVNWNIRMMACKFLGAEGYGTVADAIDCLEYVGAMKDRGVNIVATNNSWGAYGFSQALYDAIDAHRSRGILFIAAAGNGNLSNDLYPAYPASYFLPNVISVAATDNLDKKSWYSDYGNRSVYVGAPGNEILSIAPGNAYATLAGTSMAAPHVAGVAALLKAQLPDRDWKTIKNLIIAGGDTIPSLVNATVSGSRVSAYGSLTCSNSSIAGRVWPRKERFTTGIAPVKLAVLNIKCGSPNGAVTVTVSPTNERISLADDGLGADPTAGDGIYSGEWVPPSGGLFTLAFPNNDLITITVDTDLEPGFPVKTLHTPGTFHAGPALHTLVGNIDATANSEIIVTGLALGPLYVWRSDGSPVSAWVTDDLTDPVYPALAELSKDSLGLEVVSACWGPEGLAAYAGGRDSLPGWPIPFGASTPPSAADIDGDGLDEVFLGGDVSLPYAFRRDGSALPGWPPRYDLHASQERHTPAIADLDGDGKLEIVTASGPASDGTFLGSDKF